MFELKDLPSYEILQQFARKYNNPDVDGLHTWLIWATTSSEMLAAFDTNLAKHNLSQSKFFVLILLMRNQQGLSIGALADKTSVTSQTMTRLIDRMEIDELCNRHADSLDRRVWLISITPKGEQLIANFLPLHYEWVAKLMSQFNSEQRKILKDLMLGLKL